LASGGAGVLCRGINLRAVHDHSVYLHGGCWVASVGIPGGVYRSLLVADDAVCGDPGHARDLHRMVPEGARAMMTAAGLVWAESEALVLSYVGGRLECLGTNFHWNNNGKLELE